MATSVERTLLELLRGLRAGRHRFAVIAIVGWVVAAQALLVVHGIEHSNAESSISCPLCAAAHHGAAMATVPQFPVVRTPPEPPVAAVAVSWAGDVLPSYRSRAPPID
jgi:hypothetical protein